MKFSIQSIALLATFASFSEATIVSPYKLSEDGMDPSSNTNKLSSAVLGSGSKPLAQTFPDNLQTITLAFAVGECGNETWGEIKGADFASANIDDLVNSGRKYIISTGGSSDIFTCGSKEGFEAFVNRYKTDSLFGIDFDIENQNYTEATIKDLVTRAKEAESTFPNLKFSFTIPAESGNSKDPLEAFGKLVVKTVQDLGMKNYYINLMAMEYGDGECTLQSAKPDFCDMGQSAIVAINSLNQAYNVPMANIGVTAMIGQNEGKNQIFTIDDAKKVAQFAVSNNLAGVHHWSYDRDRDTPASSQVVPDGNSYGTAGTLGFTKTFLDAIPQDKKKGASSGFERFAPSFSHLSASAVLLISYQLLF